MTVGERESQRLCTHSDATPASPKKNAKPAETKKKSSPGAWDSGSHDEGVVAWVDVVVQQGRGFGVRAGHDYSLR